MVENATANEALYRRYAFKNIPQIQTMRTDFFFFFKHRWYAPRDHAKESVNGLTRMLQHDKDEIFCQLPCYILPDLI